MDAERERQSDRAFEIIQDMFVGQPDPAETDRRETLQQAAVVKRIVGDKLLDPRQYVTLLERAAKYNNSVVFAALFDGVSRCRDPDAVFAAMEAAVTHMSFAVLNFFYLRSHHLSVKKAADHFYDLAEYLLQHGDGDKLDRDAVVDSVYSIRNRNESVAMFMTAIQTKSLPMLQAAIAINGFPSNGCMVEGLLLAAEKGYVRIAEYLLTNYTFEQQYVVEAYIRGNRSKKSRDMTTMMQYLAKYNGIKGSEHADYVQHLDDFLEVPEVVLESWWKLDFWNDTMREFAEEEKINPAFSEEFQDEGVMQREELRAFKYAAERMGTPLSFLGVPRPGKENEQCWLILEAAKHGNSPLLELLASDESDSECYTFPLLLQAMTESVQRGYGPVLEQLLQLLVAYFSWETMDDYSRAQLLQVVQNAIQVLPPHHLESLTSSIQFLAETSDIARALSQHSFEPRHEKAVEFE